MKRSLRFVFAVVLAGCTSLAAAQIAPYGSNLSSSAGLSDPLLTPLSPYGSAMSSSMGLGYTTPLSNRSSVSSRTGLGYAPTSPLNPGGGGPMVDTLSPVAHYPVVNCHPGGCSGVDGTQ